jgi:arylsulfatase A-like enzyme
LLLGRRPSTTGIYGLLPWFRNVPALKESVTLPKYFTANGYHTAATGKIYHSGPAQVKAEFDFVGKAGGVGVKPAAKLVGETPMGNNPLVDWGVFPHKDEDKGDYQVAGWTIDQLKHAPTDRPFFLAAGFFLPHVPMYATDQWFSLYPDDDSVLPKILADDRTDTPHFSWYLHWSLPEPRLPWLQEHHQWRNLVRSYLACTSFVDAQVGRILQALDETGLAQNTIVVLWGDNGWHLGEKGITGKNSLWEESTHVPLIIAGPGAGAGGRITQPAELLDIYPTLTELCSLPAKPDLEGLSLVPQLKDPAAKRERPAITTSNQGNHAIRSEWWRYIHYADGSEELYNLQKDPQEWLNLAGNAEFASILNEHKKWLPKINAAPAPGSAERVLTYDAATDEVTWEKHLVKRSDAVPE